MLGQGSSPLTRGKQRGARDHRDAPRLIPAHAGKTGGFVLLSLHARAHPRSRGENVATGGDVGVGYGSSPLTRGKPP